jgi:hypothetical protein
VRGRENHEIKVNIACEVFDKPKSKVYIQKLGAGNCVLVYVIHQISQSHFSQT